VPEKIAFVAPDGTAGALLRAARRRADLSQRQLAETVGVSRRTVERAESGEAQVVSVGLLTQLLAVAGCRLIAVDDFSRPLLVAPADQLRDRAGRSYPAHLDVRVPRRWLDWWGDLPFSTYADKSMAPRQRPRYTFDRSRPERDARRATSAPKAEDG
jgi:transcriptional regulator with XRE-family HTH domain